MAEAEHPEPQIEEFPDASARLRRIVLVLRGDETQSFAGKIFQKVAAENDPLPPRRPEGIVGVGGARSVDRPQSSRQAAGRTVRRVGFFLEILRAARRVDLRPQLSPESPGRALVARGAEDN